ncbi:lysin B [Gordonia phage Buggaboo]|uniref:Lysin B n=1 Tax=Gordonia phage Buggaboo TaxID=2315529 RepID=A0A386KCY2_9CAUD|nr:lysin B [Gordonia phage Buggaboo]AVE00678.1 lysin B [Gordonia phage SuperSulley]AYD83212.1 lysin B [Gordonia phage Buggaboo]
MTEVLIRTLRGTGEPLQQPNSPLGAQPGWPPSSGNGVFNPGNMSDEIVREVATLGVRHVPIPYPASIAPAGGTKMFHQSYAEGYRAMEIAGADPRPTIYFGYSLGAIIAGDAAAAGDLPNCIGLILISDPLRHPDQIVPECGVGKHLYGCAGKRFIAINAPVYSYSVRDDTISALAADNGFRLFSDIVTGYRQPWKVGYANLGAIADAAAKYLGTPPTEIFGRKTPAKPSRHVVYNSENMPLMPMTHTAHAAGKAMQIAANHI